MNDHQPIGGGGGEENNSRRRQVVAPPQNQPHPPPPPPPPPQSCPRCNSTNTKFCYYNNYSLSQPRYFCKGCRRYWTQGGTLRNVPVGGGCRKSKRPKLSSSASTSSAASTSQSQAAADVNPAAALVGSTVNYNNHPFYGGGFLGPNLSLLHGFSLPSFDQHHHQPPPPPLPPLQPPQHNQEPPPFQPFFPIRQGLPTTSGDWNPNIDHNSNQWHDFTGGSGLDDP